MSARKSEPGDREQRGDIAKAAEHGFGFYVYTLSDAGGVFYVGKGQGARMFTHGGRADRNNPMKRLRLTAEGAEVKREVVAFFDDEHAALLHEAALIGESEGLTNVASGGIPLNSRERAQLDALVMPAVLTPRHQFQPPPGIDPIAAFSAYDAIVESCRRDSLNPCPTIVSFDPRTRRLRYGYGPNRVFC